MVKKLLLNIVNLTVQVTGTLYLLCHFETEVKKNINSFSSVQRGAK